MTTLRERHQRCAAPRPRSRPPLPHSQILAVLALAAAVAALGAWLAASTTGA